ncbi:MAG: 2-succinyl-5-enolpyruvyl-6-hydroxy-3-cyclohexene-1-carboxylic-acid synthase [Bacteroidia bacterium]
MSTAIHKALENLVDEMPSHMAVVSPGSRNAAVIEALISTGYELYSAVDERSAAFQALGMAKSSGSAVVLSCTSGTAALNYYPAIAEAYYARIPLIVVTADRPAELIDQWEGQSIRQKGVFDQHIRASFELSDKHSSAENIVQEILSIFQKGIHGPVHINIPIAEPFYTQTELVSGAHRVEVSLGCTDIIYIEDYIDVIEQDKVLLVHGMRDDSFPHLDFRNQKLEQKAVILADVTSRRLSNIQDWDAVLTSSNTEDFKDLGPDVLITSGTFNLSKSLKAFIKTYNPRVHYHFGHSAETANPFGTLTQVFDANAKKENFQWNLNSSYYQAWKDKEERYHLKLSMLNWNDWNEMTASKAMFQNLSGKEIVHFSNSMPIRYASMLRSSLKSKQLYANRGTSGIDGCSSTALGYAMAKDEQVFLFSGDVAFFYDINAWYRDSLPDRLKVIVLNNKGGRIFEYIDGPSAIPERLKFQLTSHERSTKTLCTHFGLEYFCVENSEMMQSEWEAFTAHRGIAVLEVKTDPILNKEFYHSFKNLFNE